MAYKNHQIILRIIDNLSFSSKATALENVIGLFDSNRVAQSFFATLFGYVYGYKNLEELDKLNDVSNYPAIDLGDKKAKVAIQVTTQNDHGKIQKTIDKFLKHNLDKSYDRLIVFIIGKKQDSYPKPFTIKRKFKFNKVCDIWDDENLTKQIDKITDISKLKEIEKFLDGALSEYKFPDRLFEKDIRACIVILNRDLKTLVKKAKTTSKQSIPNRTQDFIKKKNAINKISWDFFKEKILGHLKYNEMISSFLSDPINQKIQKDYLLISASIQQHYKKNKKTFKSFEDVFRRIFENLKTYDEEMDSRKVRIILHNMYFNCDIGDNA